MSIKFHCVFPWLTRNTWSEMISLTGDCELASSLPILKKEASERAVFRRGSSDDLKSEAGS